MAIGHGRTGCYASDINLKSNALPGALVTEHFMTRSLLDSLMHSLRRLWTLDAFSYSLRMLIALGGVMAVGDEVLVLPSGFTSRIASIDGPDGSLQEAFAGMAVVVHDSSGDL